MMNLYASQGAADVDIDRLTADFRADRPLRMELEAIERILTNIDIGTLTCLDFGFANPVGSLSLRRLGGYWSTVVRTEEQCRNATALIGEDALQVGENFELPFDDKQFDVVVVARGHLTGDFDRDEALIQECHRVLKTPGYLIISGDYRKRFNLAGLVSRQHDKSVNGGYDERQLFDLLKTGFDVLGVKTFCRFWVQVTRHMLDTHDCSKGRTTGFLFWVANQLDFFLFFAKGYQILAYGRRKGWRPRQPMGVHHGMSISESVLRRSRI